MLLPLRPQTAAEAEPRRYCLIPGLLLPPSSSFSSPLPSLINPSVHPLSSSLTHTDLRIASSGIMTNDSPEEETRAPGSGGGGGAGGGRGVPRRNRADDNVTILTSSMDLQRVSRSRASSSNDAAPSLTSSVDLSTSSLELSIQTRIFKIIVIGDSNVGKTCLTFRFTGGSFPDKTEATIGVDFREKAVEIEGETIKVKTTEGLDVEWWCLLTPSSSSSSSSLFVDRLQLKVCQWITLGPFSHFIFYFLLIGDICWDSDVGDSRYMLTTKALRVLVAQRKKT